MSACAPAAPSRKLAGAAALKSASGIRPTCSGVYLDLAPPKGLRLRWTARGRLKPTQSAGPLAGSNTQITLHRWRVQTFDGLAEHSRQRAEKAATCWNEKREKFQSLHAEACFERSIA